MWIPLVAMAIAGAALTALVVLVLAQLFGGERTLPPANELPIITPTRASVVVATQQPTATRVLTPTATASATPVSATVTATTAPVRTSTATVPAAVATNTPLPTSTAAPAPTDTAVAATATATVAVTSTPALATATATPPPCGQTTMSFSPNAPMSGQQVTIDVTSGSAYPDVSLEGPDNPSGPNILAGGLAYIWRWIVVTSGNPGDQKSYTFKTYAGAGTCATGSFTIAAPTATPTVTPTVTMTPTPTPAAILVGDNLFSPASVIVRVGQLVTWTNSGSVTHTTTRDGSWDIQLPKGQSASVTISTAGTLSYYCKIHPSVMTGTLQVNP